MALPALRRQSVARTHMTRRVAVVLAFLACSTAVHAQDRRLKDGKVGKVGKVVQQFAEAVPLAAEKPAPKVDDRLLAGFVSRLAACYQRETQQPLSDGDHALLVEYAPEL